MNKLIVLTDLGTFRAFQLEQDGLNSTPRLKPVDEFKIEEGDDRIGHMLTDQAGQFGKGAKSFATVNDMSNGERHNIWQENHRRSVKQIARKMAELLTGGPYDTCYLAAASEINHEIVQELPPQARGKISRNLTCNLVNSPKDKILEHFEKEGGK